MRCIMSPSPKRAMTATLPRLDAARTHFLQCFEVFRLIFVCGGHGGLGLAHRLRHITEPRQCLGEIIESRGMTRHELDHTSIGIRSGPIIACGIQAITQAEPRGRTPRPAPRRGPVSLRRGAALAWEFV